VAAADMVVLVEVRDVANLGELQASTAATRRRPADLELAEAGGERAQLLVRHMLIVEHDDRMAVDRPPQLVEGRIVDRSADIETADLGADMRMKRPDHEGHGNPPA